MDYKKEIEKMLEKINDENVLEYLYIFIKGKTEGYQ